MSKDFQNLLENSSKEELTSILQENPDLMTEQDENGRTLLHHLIFIASKRWSLHVDDLIAVLLNTPSIDFSIKNNNGSTALHQCIMACKNNPDMARKVLSPLLKKAFETNFDFRTLDDKTGKTILQLATITPCRFAYYGLETISSQNLNLTKLVLDNTQNAAIDAYSATGATAFYYAVNYGNLDRAHTLLQTGANPRLGNDSHKPLLFVQNLIQEIDASKRAIQETASATIDTRQTDLKQMHNLILAHSTENDVDETILGITKN